MKLPLKLKKVTLAAALTLMVLQTSLVPAYASSAKETGAEETADESSEGSSSAQASDYIDVSDIPDLAIDTSEVSVDAPSAIVMDEKTGVVLYEKDADTQRAPASITKIMTALVILDNCSLDEEVDYPYAVFNSIPSDSSVAGINEGAEITVEDSLYALMLASANEAAAALAIHAGGSISGFADMMNAKAEELGCTNSHFMNPHGCTEDGHYVSARDMAIIMRAAMKNEDLKTFMSALSYTITSSTLTDGSLTVYSHVKIIQPSSDYYYQYCKYGKTGYTNAAMNTLVTMSEKDGRQLICVILKDDTREQACIDTKNLMEWAFNNTGEYALSDLVDLDYLMENGGRYSADEINYIRCLTDTSDKSDAYILCNGNLDAIETSIDWKDPYEDFGTLCDVTISCDGKTLTSYSETYDTTDSAAKDYKSFLNKEAIRSIFSMIRSSRILMLICIGTVAFLLIIGMIIGAIIRG